MVTSVVVELSFSVTDSRAIRSDSFSEAREDRSA